MLLEQIFKQDHHWNGKLCIWNTFTCSTD